MTDLEKIHIPAGAFEVASEKPALLQAFLGTCVGVTLVDPVARVGGLIHLLLPEPVTPGTTYNLEKYASTGLPLFIRAMEAEGASAGRMEACIAGGALVGPVSEHDISLDIGGRTAEIAKEILAGEKITVKSSETGGFFTCSLNLDMTTFRTDVEPSVTEEPPPDFTFRIPSEERIEKAMDALQPIPQVALKILRLVTETECDTDTIARELARDQVLAAKTLKLCNSAMFAGRVQIASLNDALLLLGNDLLVKMVISAAVKNFYNQSDSGYSLCKGGLYHHAVGTALIAEKIAKITGAAPPATAYTAGLLHDIGMVVLDQFIAEAAPLFYRGLENTKGNVVKVEKKLIGTSHCEVGELLALLWNLPDSICGAISHHHRPEQATSDTELPHIVYVADLVMSRFHSGLELERVGTGRLAARLGHLGLSVDDFSGLLDRIPVEVFGAFPEQALTKG